LAQGLVVATVAVRLATLLTSLPDGLTISIRLAAIVCVLVWVHEAATTVRYRRGVTVSPSMAVAWFFVPFANFWMPFRALREIDRASDRRARSQPTPWIATWQVVSVLVLIARVSVRVAQSSGLTIANWLVDLALSASVIGTIRALEPNLVRLRHKKKKKKT
jgi:hypothetical protein